MTMLSFRTDDEEARRVQQWAEQLGVDRSELLRNALHSYLTRLASERDAETLAQRPYTKDELALMGAESWGPAEDWSDWAEALDAPR